MPQTTWHTLEEINGIGPVLASQISALGLPAVECLLRSAPLRVAQDLEHLNGVTLDNAFNEFIPQAALLRLPNMTPEALRVLHEKRMTYARLSYWETDSLVSLFRRENVDIAATQVLLWQLDAAKRVGKGTILIKVLDSDGAPVEGADVYVSDPPKTGDGIAWHWTSREDGFALVEFLAPGLQEIGVQMGDAFQRVKITFGQGEQFYLHMRLERIARNGILHDERSDGIAPVQRPWIRRTVTSLDEFDIGEMLEVTALDEDSARLSTILRRQEGASWTVDSIQLSPTEIGPDIEIGAVYEWTGDGFSRRDGSSQSIRNELQLAAIQSRISAGSTGGE